MKRYQIYLLFCLMFCAGFALMSCENKSKEPVMVVFNYSNVATVTAGALYYFPLVLDDGTGPMPFEIASSPEGSKVITMEGKSYLKWKPVKKGSYEVVIRNEENSFQQGYEIVVK